MLKIFLASHGHLASGIKSSLEILLGKADNITVFDAYVNETSVQEELDKFYSSICDEDQVLLLSDLYGGSVNSVLFTYLNKPNTFLVAGINLAFVLEIAIQETVSESEIEFILNQSREMMKLVKIDSINEEQEDFF